MLLFNYINTLFYLPTDVKYQRSEVKTFKNDLRDQYYVFMNRKADTFVV